MSMPMGEPATAETDAQFLTAMVPHYQAASDMAKIALQRAQDPRVEVRSAHHRFTGR